MTTVYFGLWRRKLQFRSIRAEGRTVQMQKVVLLRRRLFHRRKRADVLAALLVELLGRPAS
jgi:hypothetical protein